MSTGYFLYDVIAGGRLVRGTDGTVECHTPYGLVYVRHADGSWWRKTGPTETAPVLAHVRPHLDAWLARCEGVTA